MMLMEPDGGASVKAAGMYRWYQQGLRVTDEPIADATAVSKRERESIIIIIIIIMPELPFAYAHTCGLSSHTH